MPLKQFYLDAPLAGGRVGAPAELAHRLSRVLRMAEGDNIAVFNGRDGLWQATLADGKARVLHLTDKLLDQPERQPLVLALGVPKREAWETALRQATEMGVTDIVPLFTEHSVVGRLNTEKSRAHLIEAAEQSESLHIPRLHAPAQLEPWLDSQNAKIGWAYERGASAKIGLTGIRTLLVGPEGGFSPAETELLAAHANVVAFTLPTGILRTDTAVVAALAALLVA